MGQRHHVARFAQVVEHHIGVHLGHGGMREGAGRLALLHARVDPTLGEKGLGQFRHARVKGRISLAHQPARLLPAKDAVFFHRQGRVAVPDLHPLQPQPLGLQRVIAVRQPRIGGDDRIAQRLHHLGLDMVRQVAAGLRRRQLAPAVRDFLFLGQRVVHTGKERQLFAKGRGQGPRAGLAARAVMVGQQVQRRLDAQPVALDLERHPRDGFVEELVPSARPHDRLIVQEPLQLVRQLVGLHRPHPVKNRLVAQKSRVTAKDRVVTIIGDAVELEAEKHQRRRVGRDPVLHVRHELGAARVGRVLVVAQPRIGHDPACHHVDLLVAGNAIQHARRIKPGQLALVIGGETGAFPLQPRQIPRQLGRTGACVKIRQVPVRQSPQRPAPGVACGVTGQGGGKLGQMHGEPLRGKRVASDMAPPPHSQPKAQGRPFIFPKIRREGPQGRGQRPCYSSTSPPSPTSGSGSRPKGGASGLRRIKMSPLGSRSRQFVIGQVIDNLAHPFQHRQHLFFEKGLHLLQHRAHLVHQPLEDHPATFAQKAEAIAHSAAVILRRGRCRQGQGCRQKKDMSHVRFLHCSGLQIGIPCTPFTPRLPGRASPENDRRPQAAHRATLHPPSTLGPRTGARCASAAPRAAGRARP